MLFAMTFMRIRCACSPETAISTGEIPSNMFFLTYVAEHALDGLELFNEQAPEEGIATCVFGETGYLAVNVDFVVVVF